MEGGYKILKKLGEGSYGKVYEVTKDGKIYALKMLEEDKKLIGIKNLREVDVMGKIIHPNLTPALDFFVEFLPEKETSKTGILMEKAEGDIVGMLRDRSYSFATRLQFCRDITNGIKALHDSRYLHMDVKPLNVLRFGTRKYKGKEQLRIKAGDFGLSLLTENGHKEYPLALTTVTYRSVNVLNGDRDYTAADDVWSLALLFIDLLSYGHSIYKGYSVAKYTDVVVKQIYEERLIPNAIDVTLDRVFNDIELKKIDTTKYKNMLKGMLEFDPKKRMKMEEVMKILEVKYVAPQYVSLEVVSNKKTCEFYSYVGFDILFRLFLRLPVGLETFFLAADMYERSLEFRSVGESDSDKLQIAAFHAALSAYMAIKLVESYEANPKQITELTTLIFGEIYALKPKEKLFSPQRLILGESIYVTNQAGILYPNNLFTVSRTRNGLIEGIELARNCFIYSRIDLPEWGKKQETKQETKQEKKQEKQKGKEDFNKYIKFADLAGESTYYAKMKENDYLRKIYEEDKEYYSQYLL